MPKQARSIIASAVDLCVGASKALMIAFIGLGNMGYAMAIRLREQGFNLIVWNRSIEKAKKLEREAGVEVAKTPMEAASKADEIHVMVSDVSASASVFMGSDGVLKGLKQGTRVFEHSTLKPSYTSLLSKIVESRGGKLVEAPVIGGPRQAREGKLLVLVGGDPDEANTASLKALGDVVYIGPIPAATAAKLAFNILFLAVVGSMAESLSLVKAYGVEPREFYEKVVSKTWLKQAFERYLERGLNPDTPALFRLVLAAKDAAYAADALREKALASPVSSALASAFSEAAQQGLQDKDYTNLIYYRVRLASQS